MVRDRVLVVMVTMLVVAKPDALLKHNAEHHPAVEIHLRLGQERQEKVLDDPHRTDAVLVMSAAPVSATTVSAADGEGDALAVAAAAAAVASVRVARVDFETAAIFVRVGGLRGRV